MTDSEHGLERSFFAQAIDITRWLERDRSRPYLERVHRDREIGREMPPRKDDIARIMLWWARLAGKQVDHPGGKASGDSPEGQESGWVLQRMRSLVSLAMLLLGSIAGASVSLTLFHYTGVTPVNVAVLVGVFAGLQLVLVGLSVILFLPLRLPGMKAMQSLIASFNPGAVAGALMNSWARRRNGVPAGFQWPPRESGWLAPVARWQVLFWSQLAGVSFNLAALLCALLLITFTDLAFGWSTTLKVDAVEFEAIVRAFSLPWASFWPAAVPSSELIEHSRFFRLSSDTVNTVAGQSLTGWWPFVLACMLFYGLLPRFLLLVISWLGLKRTLKQQFAHHPAVVSLLQRLQEPEISLLDQSEDSVRVEQSEESEAGRRALPENTPTTVILWGRELNESQLTEMVRNQMGLRVVETFSAGGGQSLAEDRMTLENAVVRSSEVVLVVVRAWEPPLAETLDFLSSLDQKLASQSMIVILPLDESGAWGRREDALVWRRSLSTLSSRCSVEVRS